MGLELQCSLMHQCGPRNLFPVNEEEQEEEEEQKEDKNKQQEDEIRTMQS